MNAIERYVAPKTLQEALEILRGGGVTILAGGTDLMPQINAGRMAFQPVLMNLRRVAAMQGIALEGNSLRIGALATITELLTHPMVREKIPVLSEAADHFASDQIRNAGTLGGSLCNASPAGDLAPPLLVLDAVVELASKAEGAMKIRALPLREFFTGPGRTQRAPHELLTAVLIPLPRPGHTARFYKFGTRPALDIAAISIAVGGVRSGKTLKDARVAFGAVAPTPIRGPKTEAALEGTVLDEAGIERIAMQAQAEVRPISDIRASEWYRRELVLNMMKRMLRHVAES
jgi:xanthine dehydrogenase FAD-binding subunit